MRSFFFARLAGHLNNHDAFDESDIVNGRRQNLNQPDSEGGGGQRVSFVRIFLVRISRHQNSVNKNVINWFYPRQTNFFVDRFTAVAFRSARVGRTSRLICYG